MIVVRYYLKNVTEVGQRWKKLLKIEEGDVCIESFAGQLVYVNKHHIDDLQQYRVSADDEFFTEIEAQDIMVVDKADVPQAIVQYLLFLEELDGDCDIDDYNDVSDEDEILYDDMVEEFLEFMESESYSASTLPSETVWNCFDGSNWIRIILSTECMDEIKYENISKELEGMEEIDTEVLPECIYRLYKLRDGRRMIEEDSFYQGSLWEVSFIYDNDIDTVEKALDYVENKIPLVPMF